MSKITSKFRYFLSIVLAVSYLSSPSNASYLPDLSGYKVPLVAAGAAAAMGVAYYFGATPDASTVMKALPCDPERILNTSLAPRLPGFLVNSTSMFQVAVEVPSAAPGWSTQLIGWISDCYNPLAYTTYAASQNCLEFCYSRLRDLGRTSDCLAFVRCFSNGTRVLTCDTFWDRWFASVNSIYNASADILAPLPNDTNMLLDNLQYHHSNLTFHWFYEISRPLRDGLLTANKLPLKFWGL